MGSERAQNVAFGICLVRHAAFRTRVRLAFRKHIVFCLHSEFAFGAGSRNCVGRFEPGCVRSVQLRLKESNAHAMQTLQRNSDRASGIAKAAILSGYGDLGEAADSAGSACSAGDAAGPAPKRVRT